MKLVICEKPSVGAAVAAALGVREKKDGYIEGNGYFISWCIGHLVGLAEAAVYGEQYRKWSYDSLPILPQEWQYTVAADKGKQFKILKDLMHRADVSEVVNACDAGREGELIFRFVYEMAGCKKPFTRLWISSMETGAIKCGFENLKDGRGYDALYHSALCRAKAELVYSAELTPGTSHEDIYTRFNIDHPKDFKGHSLSVSDVVVLHQNGQDAAHYVDSFGYKEVPEFLQEQTQQPEKINPLKHVEDTIEQNDNSFDGIINNTPTVDELEAKVKAGEQISLVDLAEAIKADKERGKEKPSIRAQLKADKERAGKKKPTKQKSQDLERS